MLRNCTERGLGDLCVMTGSEVDAVNGPSGLHYYAGHGTGTHAHTRPCTHTQPRAPVVPRERPSLSRPGGDRQRGEDWILVVIVTSLRRTRNQWQVIDLRYDAQLMTVTSLPTTA